MEQLKKNLVTASYVSSEMEALHDKAREAGIVILCEMGLDPGIGEYTMTCSTFICIRDKLSGRL